MPKHNQIIVYAICAWCLLTWPGNIFAAEEPTALKIGTMDLPPYGWEDARHKKHGIIYELNQEIGIRSGVSFTNEILPHNRMYGMLKNGEIDLISSQAHQAALDAGDQLAVQFTINVIAATKKGSGIEKIEDFKGKKLIYHYAASYPQLDGLPPQEIERTRSYRQMLKMLYRRPFQGAVFSEPAYYYWMKDAEYKDSDFGKVIIIEEDKKQWIFLRKGMPAKTRAALKRIVENIYQENLYEKLLEKYGRSRR